MEMGRNGFPWHLDCAEHIGGSGIHRRPFCHLCCSHPFLFHAPVFATLDALRGRYLRFTATCLVSLARLLSVLQAPVVRAAWQAESEEIMGLWTECSQCSWVCFFALLSRAGTAWNLIRQLAGVDRSWPLSASAGQSLRMSSVCLERGFIVGSIEERTGRLRPLSKRKGVTAIQTDCLSSPAGERMPAVFMRGRHRDHGGL
ncbi:hypothetical protein C8Q73DRAFT_263116 [Cubamyces lactineus]|nr:hypothetical protein C8Q73DRAFT_263116 [Cubamyces lactineus]